MADRRSTDPSRASWLLYGVTTAVLLVVALAAGILVGPSYAVSIIVLAVLMLGFFAVNDLIARCNLRRHDDDPLAAQDDETETVPTAHLIPDETALGDTAEAHAELNPHDVPKDAANRQAVEEQAGDDEDTTRGDEHGAAGGRQLREEEAPPSRS